MKMGELGWTWEEGIGKYRDAGHRLQPRAHCVSGRGKNCDGRCNFCGLQSCFRDQHIWLNPASEAQAMGQRPNTERWQLTGRKTWSLAASCHLLELTPPHLPGVRRRPQEKLYQCWINEQNMYSHENCRDSPGVSDTIAENSGDMEVSGMGEITGD